MPQAYIFDKASNKTLSAKEVADGFRSVNPEVKNNSDDEIIDRVLKNHGERYTAATSPPVQKPQGFDNLTSPVWQIAGLGRSLSDQWSTPPPPSAGALSRFGHSVGEVVPATIDFAASPAGLTLAAAHAIPATLPAALAVDTAIGVYQGGKSLWNLGKKAYDAISNYSQTGATPRAEDYGDALKDALGVLALRPGLSAASRKVSTVGRNMVEANSHFPNTTSEANRIAQTDRIIETGRPLGGRGVDESGKTIDPSSDFYRQKVKSGKEELNRVSDLATQRGALISPEDVRLGMKSFVDKAMTNDDQVKRGRLADELISHFFIHPDTFTELTNLGDWYSAESRKPGSAGPKPTVNYGRGLSSVTPTQAEGIKETINPQLTDFYKKLEGTGWSAATKSDMMETFARSLRNQQHSLIGVGAGGAPIQAEYPIYDGKPMSYADAARLMAADINLKEQSKALEMKGRPGNSSIGKDYHDRLAIGQMLNRNFFTPAEIAGGRDLINPRMLSAAGIALRKAGTATTPIRIQPNSKLPRMASAYGRTGDQSEPADQQSYQLGDDAPKIKVKGIY